MYNFSLNPDEEIVAIFDGVWICQGENEKKTTIALTNQRLLFLDYLKLDEGAEVLRIANGVDYIRTKDIYYKILLSKIKTIKKQENYLIILEDKTTFEFDNDRLYELLNKYLIKNKRSL